MRTIVLKVFRQIDKIICYILRVLPVKDKYIVLESEGDFCDSAKTFYDYLVENKKNLDYKIIWFVHEPELYPMVDNVLFVSRWKKINLIADYYVSISKFFVFTHPYWLKRWRKKQIVLNTTHSVAQLKITSIPSKVFDFVLCCSEYSSSIKQKVFHVQEDKTLCIGMPRIDELYQTNLDLKAKIPNYHGQRIVLSMETFKQTHTYSDSECLDRFSINVIHTEKQMYDFNQFLSENNILLLIKIHHLQNTEILNNLSLGNIIYLSDNFLNENDLSVNKLLTLSDVLLTDYSSVFYDFLVLDRPIGFLVGDINEYKRGFIVDDPLSLMPGYKIYDYYGLKDFLYTCFNGNDNYAKERAEIKKQVYKFDDNCNCERLFKWIESRNKEVLK